VLELTFDEVIKATGAELIGQLPDDTDYFPTISIDSRTIQPEQAFFAIEGERHDGHDFVEDALKKGASTIVVSSLPVPSEAWKDRTCLQVQNTISALQDLARLSRTTWGKPVVAITGSMGKTTTRVFTSTLLSQHFNVLQSPANFNNSIGVPLSLLELEFNHDIAVLELGMNHPGEIRDLGKICVPDAAVITNVGPVHLEFFSSVDEIARAKEELLETVIEEGTFFANADDPRVSEMARQYPGTVVSFGFHESAEFRVTYFDLKSPFEMEFEIKTPERYLRASVPFAGKHLLYNIVASVSVATVNGLSWQEISAGLSLLRTLPKRGQLLRLNGFTIWDESYNSNPIAVECLLETAVNLTEFGRIILILGDMLELGKDSPSLHYRLGNKVSNLNPNWLLTVGADSKQIQAGAVDSGMPVAKCVHFQNSDQTAEFLQGILQPEDLLIVKGSRGIQLDRIVDTIRRARV
jgi:UDP-N-acetylmuramoyl-tripeptide--D-alanyl-D-alanine ligase